MGGADENEHDQEVEQADENRRLDERFRQRAARILRLAGDDGRRLETDKREDHQEYRAAEVVERRHALGNDARRRDIAQADEDQYQDRRQLQHREHRQRAHAVLYADVVRPGQRGRYCADDEVTAGADAERRVHRPEVGRQQVRVRCECGDPADVIDPAGAEADDGAECPRGEQDGPARIAEVAGELRKRQNDRDHQQADEQEQPWTREPGARDDWCRQAEDAAPDDRVQREYRDAQETDCADEMAVLVISRNWCSQ